MCTGEPVTILPEVYPQAQYYPLFRSIYLKVKVTEREKKREIFHPPAHCLMVRAGPS